MSMGVVLARVLAAFTVTAAPGAAGLSGPSPTVTTGDAAATAPGQVENTGGNVVLGDPGPAAAGPTATPSAAPVVHTPPLPAPQPAARTVPRNADAAVAEARSTADAARARGLAHAEEGRRKAEEASTRAHSRADEARSQGRTSYSDDD
ncbi:MAG TPA: hypothetical protein VNB24_03415 [Acidimicrobiales bacterium]|nr:hypothetical protein [Acidimicrobiales bacterium]